jgi:hypothetical protein
MGLPPNKVISRGVPAPPVAPPVYNILGPATYIPSDALLRPSLVTDGTPDDVLRYRVLAWCTISVLCEL